MENLQLYPSVNFEVFAAELIMTTNCDVVFLGLKRERKFATQTTGWFCNAWWILTGFKAMLLNEA